MVEARQIDDAELLELIELNILYYNCLPERRSNFNYTSELLSDLAMVGAQATGLFKDGTLIGFTLGYRLSIEVFHFTSLYVQPEFRFHTKKLYEASEEAVKAQGCSSYICEGINTKGANIHKRMGAKIIKIDKDFIRYKKEF